jgi:hypothetical protein
VNSKSALSIALVLAVGLLSACSGGSGTVPPPAQGGVAPVSLSLTDTPPPGVTVISFEVTLTGAVLQPGNVSLVTTPIEIEVKRLEVEAAFLNTVNVPAGTYNSITLTLSNPELTFKNDTGAALAGCAAGAVCEIKPNAAGSFTYSGAPFPLTIIANTPIGLLVDANLNNIIQSNLSLSFTAANAFTVTQLSPVAGTGQLEDIEVEGVVANKDTASNQFTLQTFRGNIVVQVNANTQFEDFNDIGCNAANFTCVQNGQVVEVELRLMPGGVFVAHEVEFEDNAVGDELEGIVFSIDSPTQFSMVIIGERRAISGLDLGMPVTVTLAAGAQFRVDDNGLTVPATQRTLFEGSVDTTQLMPGQTLQIRRLASSSGTNINTDRVRLRGTRFTAAVASVAAPNFVVNNLASLFTAAGVSQIQVQTSSQTDFENVQGVSSLAGGNMVSLRGLLFKATPDPILIAKKVRRR